MMKNKDGNISEKNNNAKNVFNIYHVISVALLTSVVSIIMGFILSNSTTSNSVIYSEEIDEFITEYLKIKDNYYTDLDDEQAMKTALEAILNSLDDYSAVVDDSLSNTLNTKLQGTYEGFGLEIYNDENYNIVVLNVIEDTPAEAAGIRPLDVIKKIDGQEIERMSTTDFVSIIKNSNKSTFVLTIERNGVEQEITIERKKITLESVATELYERNNKKIGYIYVSLFAYNTDVQFSEALDELEGKGINSLIVDLRYNTGGHLDAVENMMSKFLDKSHIIYQLQTKKETIKYYSKTDESRNYEVVVLVNEASASASEVFAATLQEEYGATIIGMPTYGKGTVQEVQNSTSTDLQYKLTTKKWLTPKGKWINGIGVKPDVEVQLKVENINAFTDDEDNQLQAAIDYLAK